MIEIKKTGPQQLLRGDFADSDGTNCSVQESGSGPYLRLGPNTPDFDGRMLLDQFAVAALLPLLRFFVQKGRLPNGAEVSAGLSKDGGREALKAGPMATERATFQIEGLERYAVKGVPVELAALDLSLRDLVIDRLALGMERYDEWLKEYLETGPIG